MHSPRTILLQTLGPLRARPLPRRGTSPTSSASGSRRTTSRRRCWCPSSPRPRFLRRGQGGQGPVRGGPAGRVLGVLRDGRAPVHQPGHPPPRPALPLRQERRGRHHLQGLRERRAGASRPTRPARSRASGCAGNGPGGRCSPRRTGSSPCYQYSDTPSGTYWCVAAVDPGRGARLRDHARRRRSSTPAGSAAGTRPSDGCPGLPGRGLLPAPAGRAGGPLGGAWPGRRRGPTRTSCRPCRRAASRAWTRPTSTRSWSSTRPTRQQGKRPDYGLRWARGGPPVTWVTLE